VAPAAGVGEPAQTCANTTGLLGSSVGGAAATVSGAGAGVADKDVIAGALSKIPTGAPRDVQLRTTGYSYQDNTPPNSDTISGSTIHKVASGIGTYEDPISVAVPGHSGQGAQIPLGTRIYYKDFGFYGIVEDTGATDFPGATHTDIWVDGRGFSADQSKKCMDPVTKDSVAAILNPPPGLATRPPGPITDGDRCNVGGVATP
jgi:3D (Asp-Asp-Asp) domain-containing protein